jgi:glutamate dehydrogenase (NAD(P)+)
MRDTTSFVQQVSRNFDRAAALTSHDKNLLSQIRECNALYEVAFPIQRDDGTIDTATTGCPPRAVSGTRWP